MSRLVVVSNRVSKPRPNNHAAGGLAVGVQAALEDNGGLWFGWNGKVCATEPRAAEVDQRGAISYATIELNEGEYELYYNGFSNASLWPVFHYLLAYYKFDRAAFEAAFSVAGFPSTKSNTSGRFPALPTIDLPSTRSIWREQPAIPAAASSAHPGTSLLRSFVTTLVSRNGGTSHGRHCHCGDRPEKSRRLR